MLKHLTPYTHEEKQISFVIICAKYQDNWIFVREEGNKTFELPAGHLEESETSLDCAKRELYEETGAIEFKLEAIADYIYQGKPGRLYLAIVSSLAELPKYEISERVFAKSIPFPQTYPQLQPKFLNYAKEYYKERYSYGD